LNSITLNNNTGNTRNRPWYYNR